MATQRRRARQQTAAAHDQMPALQDQMPAIEELGEHPLEIRDTMGARRHGARLGLSVPGALAGALLLAATALGAAALTPLAFEGAGNDGFETSTKPATADRAVPKPTAADETDKSGASAPPKDDDSGAPEPTKDAWPDQTPKPDKTSEPKSDPKPDPTKPPSDPLRIDVALKYDHPVIEWGACEGLDFDAYKVVRSTDSTVAWPTGKNDELFAVVGAGDTRRAWDSHSATGLKLWYRVFCVRKTEDGYVVVRASAVEGIWVPKVEPTPPPDPVDLGFEVNAAEDGAVQLAWDACKLDGFTYYKVVRSTTTDNPSYFPWTDGTELIAVLGEPGATAWTDEDVASGETLWYRVQCIGYLDGAKVLLGQTDVVAVTMP
jgi:hypothetical protein